MTGDKYIQYAMRTYDGKASEKLKEMIDKIGDDIDVGGVIEACFGLTGEAGEAEDMIKKWLFHGTPLDHEELKKELGDVLWYIALMCHSFGWSMNEIMNKNIRKLYIRYPHGFSIEDSMRRVDEKGNIIPW